MKKGVLAIIVLGFIAFFGWISYFYQRSQQQAGTIEINQLKGDLQAMRGEFDVLKQQGSEWSSEKASLLSKIDSFEASYTQIKQQFDESNLTISDLQSQLDNAVSGGTKFETQLSALSSTKSELETMLADSAVEVNEVKFELEQALVANAELTATYTEIESMLSQTKATVEALKTENLDLQKQLKSVKESNIPSADELIAAQVAEAVQTRDDLQLQLDTAATDQLSVNEIESLKQQLDQASTEIDGKLKELQASRDKINELTGLLKDASGRTSNLETEVSQLTQDKAQALQELSKLESKLDMELRNRDVQIERLRDQATLLRLGSDIVFRPGSANLAQEGREVLDLIAGALDQFPGRHVTIEGHTDSVPISENLRGRYPTNWELSVARAASAARYLVDRGVDPMQLRAAGFGEYQPVADNETPEGRANNRRIEIILVPSNRRKKTAELQ